jgi:membrane protein YqaA with SNARE-associated domain
MEDMMKRVIAASVAALLAVPCFAATIEVDDDGPAAYASIQEALDNSWHGDVIIVRPGMYAQPLTFNGKGVTVRSEDPNDPAVVQATILTGSTGPAVTFDFGEGERSVLEGFTITGRGILCSSASPTISKNVLHDCEGAGITGRSPAAPTIVGNTITGNHQDGIYGCDGLIRDNTISQNSTGLAFCGGPIQDNHITANAPGGGLYYCGGLIAGNVIVGNRADTHGGGLFSCNGDIRNNVIAGNRANRQGGGLYKCTKAVTSNTIVGNIAGDQGGGLSQCPGIVRDNIIAFNSAPVGGGIYGPCNNTYNDFWSNGSDNFSGGPSAGEGDVITPPLFARDGYWDGKGTADSSDDLWVDGDYHLKSQAGRWDPVAGYWVLDDATSNCIDAGSPSSDWSAELWPHGQRINLGAYGGTPQASASLSDLGNPADLDHNAIVGPADLMRVAQQWLREKDLLAEDMNWDGRVDLYDFAVLGCHWRSGPSMAGAPVPSPMTWATRPYATSAHTVAMVATTAASTDGSAVEYYFEDFNHPQYNSGWLSFAPGQQPRWQDEGLSAGMTYWYRVRARNTGNHVETEWSERASVVTLLDDWTNPLPDPMTWETQPHVVSAGVIRMIATQADDSSGVEYQFVCTSHPAYDSDWQDSRTYELTALPKGQYSFRVHARDKSPNHNTGGFSMQVTVDLQPPTPDPMTWEAEPTEVNIGGGSFDYCATMTASLAIDDAVQVEYLFQCTTQSQFSSTWQTSREYTVKVGRKGQYHRFRVKARDTSPGHNETAWSSEATSK